MNNSICRFEVIITKFYNIVIFKKFLQNTKIIYIVKKKKKITYSALVQTKKFCLVTLLLVF